MPQFELVSRQAAMMTSSRPSRSEVSQEYVRQIERLGPDEAVRISPSGGQTIATVRRPSEGGCQGVGKEYTDKTIGRRNLCLGRASQEESRAPTQEHHP